MTRQEEIARAAYELYEKSGCAAGRDEENWLTAEKKILAASKPVRKRNAVKRALPARAPKKRRVSKRI